MHKYTNRTGADSPPPPLVLDKVLKDKFDAIFASTQFTKALDEINKYKKNKKTEEKVPEIYRTIYIYLASAIYLSIYFCMYEAGHAKKRPAVGFAVTVNSSPFCTSTTAGGTGRAQPRLVCKNRDHPVTASSDTAAKLAKIVLYAAPHPPTVTEHKSR